MECDSLLSIMTHAYNPESFFPTNITHTRWEDCTPYRYSGKNSRPSPKHVMTRTPERRILVGVLALQGAFSEHIQLLKQAFASLDDGETHWACAEIRTPEQLAECDALVIPGGESTTIALVAARSGLLEPLRSFVK